MSRKILFLALAALTLVFFACKNPASGNPDDDLNPDTSGDPNDNGGNGGGNGGGGTTDPIPGYNPQFPADGQVPPLTELGFTDVRHVEFTGDGAIRTTSPGGLGNESEFSTPEFDPLSRDESGGIVLRYSLTFPVPVGTVSEAHYKDFNRSWLFLHNAEGGIAYAITYWPRIEGAPNVADIVFYAGNPFAAETPRVSIKTDRPPVVGEGAQPVTIGLVLHPTSEAGGAGRIELLFDSGDGHGESTTFVMNDQSARAFNRLSFRYRTGTGAERFYLLFSDLQFRPVSAD